MDDYPTHETIERNHARRVVTELERIRRAAVTALEALETANGATAFIVNNFVGGCDSDPNIHALNDIDAHTEQARRQLRDIGRAAELEQLRVGPYTE